MTRSKPRQRKHGRKAPFPEPPEITTPATHEVSTYSKQRKCASCSEHHAGFYYLGERFDDLNFRVNCISDRLLMAVYQQTRAALNRGRTIDEARVEVRKFLADKIVEWRKVVKNCGGVFVNDTKNMLDVLMENFDVIHPTIGSVARASRKKGKTVSSQGKVEDDRSTLSPEELRYGLVHPMKPCHGHLCDADDDDPQPNCFVDQHSNCIFCRIDEAADAIMEAKKWSGSSKHVQGLLLTASTEHFLDSWTEAVKKQYLSEVPVAVKQHLTQWMEGYVGDIVKPGGVDANSDTEPEDPDWDILFGVQALSMRSQLHGHDTGVQPRASSSEASSYSPSRADQDQTSNTTLASQRVAPQAPMIAPALSNLSSPLRKQSAPQLSTATSSGLSSPAPTTPSGSHGLSRQSTAVSMSPLASFKHKTAVEARPTLTTDAASTPISTLTGLNDRILQNKRKYDDFLENSPLGQSEAARDSLEKLTSRAAILRDGEIEDQKTIDDLHKQHKEIKQHHDEVKEERNRKRQELEDIEDHMTGLKEVILPEEVLAVDRTREQELLEEKEMLRKEYRRLKEEEMELEWSQKYT